jgi:hypothetical protein
MRRGLQRSAKSSLHDRMRAPRPGRPEWRDEIARLWGITTVDPEVIDGGPRTLWTTRCCRIKSENGGTPQELYRSELPQRFMRCMQRLEHRYAIISDLYGLHFPEVRLPSYDTAPDDLSPEQRRALGCEIGRQARLRHFMAVAFYNNSPIMSAPYFEILSHCGIPVMYHTRLPEAS